MALAGVEGAVGGDAGGLLRQGDPVEPFRRQGRIADAACGEPGRPDVQRLPVDPDGDLAP